MEPRNTYRLPLNKKEIQSVCKNSPAHKGRLRNSIDFLVPENTKVYSALGGKVVFLKKDSNEGGPHRRYWFKGNRIVIRHRNGEYTAYEHLKYKGATVRLGQSVRKGQLIGFSGNTGYSFGPHLHFEIFNDPTSDESEGVTLKINIKELKTK